MAVPLVVGDDVYGSLAFYYQRQRELTDDEVVLATTFADQAALAIENARLYNQAEQLAVVRERERLARELHDSITQTLYSLTLLAEAGQRLAGAGQLERVRGYLEEMSGLAQQTLREMRLLVYELRPLVLKREGLVGALQHRLDSVEKRAGVKARLLVEGPLELPAGIEEGLYRVAQEALNNALKHGRPHQVSVIIRSGGGRVEMEIVDDGQGFDLDGVDGGGGMGLLSMQERIDRLGGELEVDSEPGQGTKVKVALEVS
jgi:signal transduction histidine kinase